MQREFTGVWIPKEIWENPNLSMTERCLLAEIDSLTGENGCYASREFLAERMGVSIGHVKDMITKLRKMNLIVDLAFDGRNQFISTAWKAILSSSIKATLLVQEQSNPTSEKSDGRGRKNPTAPIYSIENNLDNSKNNPIIKTPEDLEESSFSEDYPPEEKERLENKKKRREEKATRGNFRGFAPRPPRTVYVKRERTIAHGEDII
jgi:hypothetical protein